MVLASQGARAGLSRRYMSSRRRRGSKWPWIGGGVAVVAVLGVWQMLGGDDAPLEPQAAAAQTPPATQNAAPPAPVQRPGAPTPLASIAPAMKPAPKPEPVALQQPKPTPAATPVAAQPVTARPPQASPGASPAFTQGMDLIADGRLIDGRRALSDILLNRPHELTAGEAQTIRDTLMSVNKELVFSPKIIPGDPLVEPYKIQSGDVIARLAPRWKVPQQFIVQINAINPSRLHVGQTVKFIRGPFHAKVTKSEFRLDVFIRNDRGDSIYVCSYPVGLGEGDSTPTGKWIIEPGRKVQNPAWANPRTGERFDADDPKNPIGEYWLALKGTEPDTENVGGYGIHGTIQPESIGNTMSMGCVRLRDADIAQLYAMLTEGESTVEIVR